MKNQLMSRLFELEPDLRKIEILSNALSDSSIHDRRCAWPSIHYLIYDMIGWGREKDPVFYNTSTDPLLYSSEAWCEAKAYFRELVFGEE